MFPSPLTLILKDLTPLKVSFGKLNLDDANPPLLSNDRYPLKTRFFSSLRDK